MLCEGGGFLGIPFQTVTRPARAKRSSSDARVANTCVRGFFSSPLSPHDSSFVGIRLLVNLAVGGKGDGGNR
jgi:hypothetical protein